MLKKILSNNYVIYYLIEENIKMENAPIFYEEFIKHDDYLGKKVILDFSKTNFIDSSGIGILIQCSEYLKSRSSELIFVNINKSMSSIFRLSGLYQLFYIIEVSDLKNYFAKEEIDKIQFNR